jgi:pimeloyl-ACP methyl ester carboxylesterase
LKHAVWRASPTATMGRRGIAWVAFSLAAILLSIPALIFASVQEETVRIPGPIQGLKLGLRHAVPEHVSLGNAHSALLILHGSGVPVSGNPDYRLGNESLMTALAARGLDVWALDFYGFGDSDRYPEMDEAADKHPPLGAAPECADQVQAVAAYLRRARGVDKVMVMGDSGGSLVAGLFAAKHPDQVARLVLFGPVTPFSDTPSPQTPLPAYDFVTPLSLWNSFKDWSDAAGKPDVLDSSAYTAWAETYLRSDRTSAARNPPSVKIPNGRQADRAAIARGQFPYDPSAIRAPTLIVMGEWDTVATFQGAEWLLKALRQAQPRRLVVIGHGSHTIQYEDERRQLYRVIADFVSERDE